MTWPVKKKVQDEKTAFSIDTILNTRNEKMEMIKRILLNKEY